jgi:transaldolase
MSTPVTQLRVKVFADGADKTHILRLAGNPLVKGFTTNPTLMRQAGVTDYEGFAREVVGIIDGKPISFEVFSDEFDEMYEQAVRIAGWGDNVYVKIPITNTRGDSSQDLIRRLAERGVKLNVTAIMTRDQVRSTAESLAGGPPSYISVFAGRIADTGRDPLPEIKAALDTIRRQPQIELIWASPREVLNVFQAHDVGCHIITVTPEILKKLSSAGKDLGEFSLETVRMFRSDAVAAGFNLPAAARAGGL